MAFSESMPVGVVLERRALDNPWQDHSWRAVAVVPGVAEGEDWRLMREGEGWRQVFAGGCVLELFRKESGSYRYNLATGAPKLYVVLRRRDDAERPWYPLLVTAAPDEAQACMEGGDDIVEAVPMPDPVRAWIEDFVARQPEEEPFRKRQRTSFKPDDARRRGGG